MPKKPRSRTPQENEAISDMVDTLLSAGYPIEQSTAIAFRMFRDGELDIPKETSREYRLQRPRKRKSLIEQIAEASALLGLGKHLLNKEKPK